MASKTQSRCLGLFVDLLLAVFLFAFGVGSPYWHRHRIYNEQLEVEFTAHRGLFKGCRDSDLTGKECRDIDVELMPGRIHQNPPLTLTLIEDRLPKILFFFH